MKRHALLLILAALFIVWGNDSWAARTTRDLVFDDEEPAQTQAMESSGKQTTALKTTMLLKREGATSTVLPTHEFKSGDMRQACIYAQYRRLCLLARKRKLGELFRTFSF